MKTPTQCNYEINNLFDYCETTVPTCAVYIEGATSGLLDCLIPTAVFRNLLGRDIDNQEVFKVDLNNTMVVGGHTITLNID